MAGDSIANTLFIISNASFVAAAVCGIVAIILFFKFHIPSVINDLSGRSARKSIEMMRLQNDKKGNASRRSEKKKKERKEINKNSDKKIDSIGNGRPETGLLEENLRNTSASEATSLLVDEEATGLLDQNETTPLVKAKTAHARPVSSVKLKMLEEVMIVHTEETID